MREAGSGPAVGYIVRSYPRLSQTFILNEILALERLGRKIHIFALTDPREPIVQSQVAEVRAPVHYLDAALEQPWPKAVAGHLRAALAAPSRYFRTLFYVLRHKDLDAGYTTNSRAECFRQAVYLTRLLEREQKRTGTAIRHLHAHFAHTPTLIALLTHMLTGLSYSFTAHARDLYQIPTSTLGERIEHASAVVTICSENVSYLNGAAPESSGAKVRLIHNGIDLHGFQPAAEQSRPSRPPLIASAGRLVEKKGFPDLLRAWARLRAAGYRFQGVIYGDGPLHGELAAMIEGLGLAGTVRLAGACTQGELASKLREADLFALTPFVTESGDRDGVPTVLAEAMACGLPVVSTTVAGIPELVTHDHDGLLAEPHDVEAIAAALAALLDDESRRRRLGAAARRTVAEGFDLSANARQIAAIFESALAK